MAPDVSALQRALDNDELFPAFQPIVELRTGQLTGFELLARWHYANPDEFIPWFEAAGLSGRLSEILLNKALTSASLAHSSLHISFNLSPIQLQDPDLPALIAESASRAGFPTDRLVIEVTESALLKDLDRANAVACELKQLGCRLALDDFGTGYSSLRHLQALPFDKLKVDRSFVASMAEVRESRKIVAAVIGLGQSLGLTTIAEGIETPTQASMLLSLGCDLGQGWLYGKAAPIEEIPRFLEARPQTFEPTMTCTAGGGLLGLESLPGQRLAQVQAIYDGAPVGLCFLDRNLRYVSINRRLAEINGAPIREHIGKTVAEMLPDFFPVLEPLIRRAMQGESIPGVEAEKPPRADGQIETVLLSYQPARDESGEILGVSVVVVDITAQKQTEKALRELVTHFRHILELGPHLPWVLNNKGELIKASARWQEFTGQSLDDAMGDGFFAMVHPEDLAATHEAVRHCLATAAPIDVLCRIRRQDGVWIPMRSYGSPRLDDEGKIIGIYGVLETLEDSVASREDWPARTNTNYPTNEIQSYLPFYSI